MVGLLLLLLSLAFKLLLLLVDVLAREDEGGCDRLLLEEAFCVLEAAGVGGASSVHTRCVRSRRSSTSWYLTCAVEVREKAANG